MSAGGWIQNVQQYLTEVRGEFNKVTWPSQREYVGGTVGVLVIVAVITVALALIDAGLGQAMRVLVP